jgi:signal transduction histidine kinase
MTPEASNSEAAHLSSAKRGASFSRKLALAFAAVAALTAALAAILLMSVWNYQFDQYLRDNLQRVADGVSEVASGAYQSYNGWSLQTLALIPRFGPMRGVAVQILDSTGTLIYDDTTASSREQYMQEGGSNVAIQPQGPVVSSQVIVGGRAVGTVRVWAYGPGAVLTQHDEQFRSGSFSALAIAALVAIAFASVAGVWYAGRLVSPIEKITATAQALRSGSRDARTGLDGEDEIAVLGRTFDDMADAIEADRQMERRLTADVAHELRTPLQAIQATVEAMQDGVLPADEERLGVVRDETVRLARLADGILELTRLERGSMPFKLERIDVAEPVRAAVDAIEALTESRDLALSVDVADRVFVNADKDRIQQAVGNLLSNAARYTPPGGRISIALRAESGQAVIEVTDTGIGVSADDMPMLFSRFWRADAARATTTGGIGIGLAVTKEIVERHGGMIGAESEEGKGTRFTVKLPLA